MSKLGYSFSGDGVNFKLLPWLGRCMSRSLGLAGMSGRFLMDGFIPPTHNYRMSLLLQSTVYTQAIIRKSPCKCIAISCSAFQGGSERRGGGAQTRVTRGRPFSLYLLRYQRSEVIHVTSVH